MLVSYIRDENRKPVGCVVALSSKNLGVSLCSDKDKFSKEMGRKIAIGRAEQEQVIIIPTHHSKRDIAVKAVSKMAERAIRYFK